MATDDEGVQRLADYWERGEPIPWVRVDKQPDFVYFSHQPHLGAGINCETCHGNVAAMDETRPVLRMDMGWCLKCHTDQEPEHVARLADCVACHK
ncbi:MAG: cytochrome c3 family protein [Candidatus Promineifilaceae bacterium]|nr:cytochrome c3 family protein [Candidatus Promineifilaceae bacterium]